MKGYGVRAGPESSREEHKGANTLGQGSNLAELEAAWRNTRTKLQKNAKENIIIQNVQGSRK